MGGLEALVASAVTSFAKILSRLRVSLRGPSLVIELDATPEDETIDERIAKLEIARDALATSLTAIAELEDAAKRNKAEAEMALKELGRIHVEKQDVSNEVKAMRHLIRADIDAFRKAAGIPSERQRRKDKVAGFWTGVAASIVASLIVGGIVKFGFPIVDKAWTALSSSSIEQQQSGSESTGVSPASTEKPSGSSESPGPATDSDGESRVSEEHPK